MTECLVASAPTYKKDNNLDYLKFVQMIVDDLYKLNLIIFENDSERALNDLLNSVNKLEDCNTNLHRFWGSTDFYLCQKIIHQCNLKIHQFVNNKFCKLFLNYCTGK